MNYVKDLSRNDFRTLVRVVCEAQERHMLQKRRTYIQLGLFLQMLEGKIGRASFLERAGVLYDTADLVRLDCDGIFIDLYIRMKQEFQE